MIEFFGPHNKQDVGSGWAKPLPNIPLVVTPSEREPPVRVAEGEEPAILVVYIIHGESIHNTSARTYIGDGYRGVFRPRPAIIHTHSCHSSISKNFAHSLTQLIINSLADSYFI